MQYGNIINRLVIFRMGNIINEILFKYIGGNNGNKRYILKFMREEAYRPMDIQELVSVFDINPDQYKLLKRL